VSAIAHRPIAVIGRTPLRMAPVKPIPDGECCHHWVIEPPNGATSKAFCKKCPAERQFLNFQMKGSGQAYRQCAECRETFPSTKAYFPRTSSGGLGSKCHMCKPVRVMLR
jgi:hypothetical protein